MNYTERDPMHIANFRAEDLREIAEKKELRANLRETRSPDERKGRFSAMLADKKYDAMTEAEQDAYLLGYETLAKLRSQK